MAGTAEDLPLALLLLLFHRCDKAPQELLEDSRLLPLAAFLLSAACLCTLAGARASEAGFCSLFYGRLQGGQVLFFTGIVPASLCEGQGRLRPPNSPGQRRQG